MNKKLEKEIEETITALKLAVEDKIVAELAPMAINFIKKELPETVKMLLKTEQIKFPDLCDHRYTHIDTEKKCEVIAVTFNEFALQWRMRDRFFCEKCLHTKEIVNKHDGYDSKDKPEWY